MTARLRPAHATNSKREVVRGVVGAVPGQSCATRNTVLIVKISQSPAARQSADSHGTVEGSRFAAWGFTPPVGSYKQD